MATSVTGRVNGSTSAPTVTTEMSIVRTRLAFERTLMAWVRTAVSLITFGFTIYKTFEYLEEHSLVFHEGHTTNEIRYFALAMMALGLVALLLVIIEHWRHITALRELDEHLPRISIALIVAVLFTGLG